MMPAVQERLELYSLLLCCRVSEHCSGECCPAPVGVQQSHLTAQPGAPMGRGASGTVQGEDIAGAISRMSDETRAKLRGHGKQLLHFVCSNALALVLLPVVAWAVVSMHPCLACMHGRCAELAELGLQEVCLQPHSVW